MTSRLSIRHFFSTGDLSHHDAVLKSLPVSFELQEDQEGAFDIALAGGDSGSLAQACTGSPKALVVADAANLSSAVANELAETAVPVHPLLRLSSLTPYLSVLASQADASLIRSNFSSEQGLRTTLVEHLTFLNGAFGPVSGVTLLSHGDDTYAGQCTSGSGGLILFTGQGGASSSCFDLDWISTAKRLELVAELDAFARPPCVRIASSEGVSEPLPVYENPLRAFWRRLAEQAPDFTPVISLEMLMNVIRLVEGFELDARTS